MGESTYTYEVNSTVDTSGKVQFTYEIFQYGINANGDAECVWHVSITGQGKLTSPTQAAGTASFTYTCDDDTIYSDVANLCGTSTNVLGHYTYSGELPWRFDTSQ